VRRSPPAPCSPRPRAPGWGHRCRATCWRWRRPPRRAGPRGRLRAGRGVGEARARRPGAHNRHASALMAPGVRARARGARGPPPRLARALPAVAAPSHRARPSHRALRARGAPTSDRRHRARGGEGSVRGQEGRAGRSEGVSIGAGASATGGGRRGRHIGRKGDAAVARGAPHPNRLAPGPARHIESPRWPQPPYPRDRPRKHPGLAEDRGRDAMAQSLRHPSARPGCGRPQRHGTRRLVVCAAAPTPVAGAGAGQRQGCAARGAPLLARHRWRGATRPPAPPSLQNRSAPRARRRPRVPEPAERADGEVGRRQGQERPGRCRLARARARPSPRPSPPPPGPRRLCPTTTSAAASVRPPTRSRLPHAAPRRTLPCSARGQRAPLTPPPPQPPSRAVSDGDRVALTSMRFASPLSAGARASYSRAAADGACAPALPAAPRLQPRGPTAMARCPHPALPHTPAQALRRRRRSRRPTAARPAASTGWRRPWSSW
jgi:hypothetical protein